YRDAKLATWTRMLPELLGPNAEQQDLSFAGPDATEFGTTAFVLVSNNPYRLAKGAGAVTRPRLDTGRLGIVAARIQGANDVPRLVSPAAIGRSRSFRGVSQWSQAELEIHSASPVAVGLDGEAVVLEPPLRFLTLPQALRVRLPRRAPGMSPAAAATAGSRHDPIALAPIAGTATRSAP